MFFQPVKIGAERGALRIQVQCWKDFIKPIVAYEREEPSRQLQL